MHFQTANKPRAAPERPARPLPVGRSLAVLVGLTLLALMLAPPAPAQDRPSADPYEAPHLIAPASGETISYPDPLRFRWRLAQGPSAEESERYRRLYQRLIVWRSTDGAGMETASRENEPRLVRTFPGWQADRPESRPPAPPYPTVGDWFPATTQNEPVPADDVALWEARLEEPEVGRWFPNHEPRPPLPVGEYVWEVRLLGETMGGDMELLASSRNARFRVREGGRDRAPPASPPPSDASSSPEEVTPEGSDDVKVTLMPRGGMFLSGVSSFEDLSGEVGASLSGERSVLTWGGSVAFGARDGPLNFRLTGFRTTGSLVSTTEGLEADSGSVGTVRDRMLMLSGDLIVRPLPRFWIQPYVIGGAGAQRLTVQPIEEVDPSTRWDMTAQVGAGVDLRLGSRGMTLGVEVVDYLTGFTETDRELHHDAFLFLTLGVPIF